MAGRQPLPHPPKTPTRRRPHRLASEGVVMPGPSRSPVCVWVGEWVGFGRKEWVGLGWLIVVVPASVLPVNIFGNCRFPLSPDFPRGQINDVFPLGPKMEITYKLL